ncbi:hypothetical protein MCP1_820005 [Candidatus Terasakiella magnetica]|nr:hypothetical protein MCP1_820005 [Candidatus Terasakiella magnetica]
MDTMKDDGDAIEPHLDISQSQKVSPTTYWGKVQDGDLDRGGRWRRHREACLVIWLVFHLRVGPGSGYSGVKTGWMCRQSGKRRLRIWLRSPKSSVTTLVTEMLSEVMA